MILFRWDQMSWDQMSWDQMSWDQMSWDQTSWDQTSGIKCLGSKRPGITKTAKNRLGLPLADLKTSLTSSHTPYKFWTKFQLCMNGRKTLVNQAKLKCLGKIEVEVGCVSTCTRGRPGTWRCRPGTAGARWRTWGPAGGGAAPCTPGTEGAPPP